MGLNEAVLVLGSIALLMYFVRGAVGAAGAIVFNAAFVTLYALGLTGPLSLQDGLYWLALSNGLAAIVMGGSLAKGLRWEPITLWYLAGTIPVNIVFTVVLTRVGDTDALAAALAAVVMLSGIYLAARPNLPPARTEMLNRLALPVGAVGGVIGGLFGMGGPIAILLFSRSTDDPSIFRLRLTMVTGVSNLVRLGTLASQGVFTPERLTTAAWTVPAVCAGIFLGLWAHRYVKPGPFRVVLGCLIALSGLVALAQRLWL